MGYHISQSYFTGVDQKGIALLSVLITVAITASIAASLTYKQNIDITRTAHILHKDQAVLYALGAENIVTKLLLEDITRNAYDSQYDSWYAVNNYKPIFIGASQIKMSVTDMQSAVNINNLVANNSKLSNFVASQTSDLINTAIKTMQGQKLGYRFIPQRIINQIYDWLDSDNKERPTYGAEDNIYTAGTSPYLTANKKIFTATELYMIKDLRTVGGKILLNELINQDVAFNKNTHPNNSNLILSAQDPNVDSNIDSNILHAKPYVVALPITTKININTAASVVLKSLLFAALREIKDNDNKTLKYTLEEAQTTAEQVTTKILAYRKTHNTISFKTLQEFYDFLHVNVEAEKWNMLLQDVVDIKTNFFRLKTTISMQNFTTVIHSFLYRKKTNVIVMQRIIE